MVLACMCVCLECSMLTDTRPWWIGVEGLETVPYCVVVLVLIHIPPGLGERFGAFPYSVYPLNAGWYLDYLFSIVIDCCEPLSDLVEFGVDLVGSHM